MALEVKGNLYKKFETQSKSNAFQVREFVLKLDGQYPQLVKFQLTQDRCDVLNNFQENDDINVHFDLRGREWEGKFFTNLNAWKIEKIASQAAETPADMAGDFPPIQENLVSEKTEVQAEDFDDLPF